jgi:hypothetical protein
MIFRKRRLAVRGNSLVLIFWLILSAGLSFAVEAPRQIRGEGPVEIHANLGKTLEVVVQGGVSNVVRSGDAASIKVEHVSGHLFITPLLKPAAELVVMDTVGRSFRFKFVFDGEAEEKVIIPAAGKVSLPGRPGGSSVEFIRDLAGGHFPAGAVETAWDEVIFEDTRICIRAVKKYELPSMVGYVLSAQNLLPQSLVVPVEQFRFKGLLAVSCARDILSPQGTPGSRGAVYMVTSR